MSAFLAPIHTWLFNKIKLAQDLEKDIVKLHIDKYKESAIKIQKEATDIYGQYIEEKPLEDRIKEVESRSAYIITKYYDMYNEESKNLTESAYISQAIKCAQNENNKANSPEDAYISLNNYILSGMPCDRVNSVTEKNEDYIIYEQNGCIHRKNYENGQGNLIYLYELRDLWVKTFMESLSTKYLYEKENLDNKTINKIRKA